MPNVTLSDEVYQALQTAGLLPAASTPQDTPQSPVAETPAPTDPSPQAPAVPSTPAPANPTPAQSPVTQAAADVAAAVDEAESMTLGDVLRTLVHYSRLPNESLVRDCLSAIEKHFGI